MGDEIKHVLAHKGGIALVVGILFRTGAMCPACGYGTRNTSKRWAKCKKCGTRVARKQLPQPASPPEKASLGDSHA